MIVTDELIVDNWVEVQVCTDCFRIVVVSVTIDDPDPTRLVLDIN